MKCGQYLTLKKWLGFPRSLTSEALYARSAKVQLPFSSLCEEVKAARVRMKVTLETSKDACIKGAEIDLDAGTKWKVSEGVEEARFTDSGSDRRRLQEFQTKEEKAWD